MINVTLITAFIAGLISFFSPCIISVVIPYLGLITDLSINEITQNKSIKNTQHIIISSLAFILGFSSIFILLGFTVNYISILIKQYSYIIEYIAGMINIIVGLNLLNILKVPLFNYNLQINNTINFGGLFGSYIIGIIFAISWSPCISPILGAILSIAGTEKTMKYGLLLLVIYSLGLGIPFLLVSFFISSFINLISKIKKYTIILQSILGIILIIIGLLFLTGQIKKISFWLLQIKNLNLINIYI